MKYCAIPLLFASAVNTVQSDDEKNKQEFEVKLVSLNSSGVSGKVEIEIKDNKVLKISIKAEGLISVCEGLPSYGPIVLPLNPFDLVQADGSLRYKASYTINPNSIQPLENRAIVLHGMTVNGEYIASLPVACGQIKLDD